MQSDSEKLALAALLPIVAHKFESNTGTTLVLVVVSCWLLDKRQQGREMYKGGSFAFVLIP